MTTTSSIRSPRNKAARAARPGKDAQSSRKPGFYDQLYSAEEIRWLGTHPQIDAEQDLLRTVVRRLVKLTPLKQLNDKEVNALLKLVRLIAVIDALERTEVMRRKGGVIDDPLLEELAAADVDDL
jgi:hypothetical protein